MPNLGYDRLILQDRARKLYSRARFATVLGFLLGALVGAPLGAGAGFLFRFLTGLRFTIHNFMPGLNVEEATQAALQTAATWAVAGALAGAIIGAYRGAGVAATCQLTAQATLCQAEIEGHLARLGGPSRLEPPAAR